MRCGLLGASLTHSYSPLLHRLLGGDYSYELFSVAPAQLPAFLREGEFDALNVTIPYKRAVLPYCTALSEAAKVCGSVNTLLRRADGTFFGDNTDAFGFTLLLKSVGGVQNGETALIVGTGGAARTVQAVLSAQGINVSMLSHSENTPAHRALHKNAEIIINATPVGMFPHNGEKPLALSEFSNCRLVLDLIYNPAKTALLLEAEERGIANENGLLMLVAQAKRAAELFTGTQLPDNRCIEILQTLKKQTQNIYLIGMPGCGKSTVGRLLAEKLAKPFYDSDKLLEAQFGCSISGFFEKNGETVFRREESLLLAGLGKHTGCVIATGGGCVTRAENLPLLRQNGVLVWLQRDLTALATQGRPLSQAKTPTALYAERHTQYERFADLIVENNGTAAATAEKIRELLV